jgi:hypothetical protein
VVGVVEDAKMGVRRQYDSIYSDYSVEVENRA